MTYPDSPSLLLLGFLAALCAGSLAPCRHWLWSSRFLDARRNHLFSYPVELCVCLVALPLVFLLPLRGDAPHLGAVALVSALAAFFSVEYLRCHRLAWNALYTPDALACPVCASRRRARMARARWAAEERARAAEEEKGGVAVRVILVYALALVVAAALVNEARGRPDKAAEVVAVGVPAAVAVWALGFCYGRVLARRIAADAARTIALSSRPEHTRERVLAALRKRR